VDRLYEALLDRAATQGYRSADAPAGAEGVWYADRHQGRCQVAAVRGGQVTCAAALDLGSRRRVLIGSGPLAQRGSAEPDLGPLRRILPPQLQPERLWEAEE
jgi:hypothetical protein